MAGTGAATIERLVRTAGALATLAAVASCATNVAGPATEFNGVNYTAMVFDSGLLFNVTVTLQNRTGATVTRTYPARCPVRIQLFRLADNALLYDETRLDCDKTLLATVTMLGFQSANLYSGERSAAVVMGDSLPVTPHTVRVVLETEANKRVVINAGTYLSR